MSDTGWKFDPEKSEYENWQDYVQLCKELDEAKAESYEQEGTLPPGGAVAHDTTSVEANYETRDNIVVSAASPSHIQVEAAQTEATEVADEPLAEDESDLHEGVESHEVDEGEDLTEPDVESDEPAGEHPSATEPDSGEGHDEDALAADAEAQADSEDDA